MSAAELMEQGIACLVERFGVIDAEYFISMIKKDDFDYTKWQREYFDRMSAGEFMKNATEYAGSHSYKGNAKILL